MNIKEAINHLNKLKDDAKKLEDWLIENNMRTKPISGKYWRQIYKNVEDVLDNMYDEIISLEQDIDKVIKDIGEIEIRIDKK